MHDDADVIRVVEGRCGAIVRSIIEVPLWRSVLPDELVEVVPVFGVPEPAALRGKVVLVPPPQFSRWRQRLQVCLEVGDQITAHGDERLAAFRPERRDDGGRSRSPIETRNDCLLDPESIHQSDNVESNGRLLTVPERFAREKTRRAVAPQIRDDGPVARRCQQRSDIDVAVDVVGPTVQKNDHGTIGGTDFSVTNIQEASIDLLDGAERGVRPRLGRGDVGSLYLARLCASGTDHSERGGSNGRGRGAQESAAMMVHVFGHLSAPVRIKWMA